MMFFGFFHLLDAGKRMFCARKSDYDTMANPVPSIKINTSGQMLTRRLPYPTNVSVAEQVPGIVH
jgi:hypothetical protein